MAVAEKAVKHVVTTVEQEVVILTLSKEEAQFVLDYLSSTVLGAGLRKHSDSVCNALASAGCAYDYNFCLHIEGNLKRNRFKD